MNNNYKNIFSTSDCPSPEQVELYVSDKLSRTEKYHFEQHLSECEICQDELEGLSSLTDKGKLNGIVNQINNSVDSRIKRENNNPVFQLRTTPDYRIKRVLAVA